MTFKLNGTKAVLLSAALVIIAGTCTAAAAGLPSEGAGTGGTILGDANCDGAVDIRDVTCIQRILAEWEATGNYSEAAADVNKSGSVEINDASSLQRWLADMETTYQIGEELDTPPETTQPLTDELGFDLDVIRP